jgi:hypothetical protein
MFEMAKPTGRQQRALWVAYFILGLAVPLIIWNKRSRRAQARRQEIDDAHDITVEDSFPASDPPSAW